MDANGEFTKEELLEFEKHLDDETEWTNIDEFWQVWGPRVGSRIRILIKMALKEKE